MLRHIFLDVPPGLPVCYGLEISTDGTLSIRHFEPEALDGLPLRIWRTRPDAEPELCARRY